MQSISARQNINILFTEIPPAKIKVIATGADIFRDIPVIISHIFDPVNKYSLTMALPGGMIEVSTQQKTTIGNSINSGFVMKNDIRTEERQ